MHRMFHYYYSTAQINQYKSGIVKVDSIVVPRVNATAFFVSPLKLSENVEARPAVGVAKATKIPRIISALIKPSVDFTASAIPTITIGNTTNFNAETSLDHLKS